MIKTAVIALLLAFVLVPGHAASRVALLIGNSSYTVGKLTNPPSDVREIEGALKAAGFTVQTVFNANQNAMKRAVRDFGNLAQGADIAFLYYSGHGTQVNGENYLIPVQANIDKEADYEVEAVSANAVMRQIAGARPKAAIVVLDACRDNPLSSATKSTSKGLSRMDAPTGTMIAFATSPNTTATDEGVYARTLAKQIRTPGLEIVDVFRNTTAEVRKATNGKQEPRISEMSITERIYLVEGTDRIVRTPVAPAPAQQMASLRAEPEPVVQRPAVPQAQAEAQVGQVFKDCPDCPEMVVLPAGSFSMGSNKGGDESPAHPVSLARPFAMGKYEVTQGQWKAVMGWNPSVFQECGEACPVEKVSWNDAQDFIQKLNAKTGKSYRLPSEAEWEYACRAGGTHEYCGSDDVAAVGWYGAYATPIGNSAKKPNPVGLKQANALGLYDMSGNLKEWVQDWHHDSYSGAPVDGSAWESGGEQKYRVLRGGSWDNYSRDLRSSRRFRSTPESSFSIHNGFRLARTVP